MKTKRIAFDNIVILYPDNEDFKEVWKRLEEYMKIYLANHKHQQQQQQQK